MKKIRILIADDHAVLRMGLSALFSTQKDLEVVGQSCDGEAAVRDAALLKPDVVVMDLMMPKKDGGEAIVEIRRQCPDTRIIVLTSCSTSDGLAQAIRAGALGVVMKSAENAEIITAIRKAASGERYITGEVEDLLKNDPPIRELSKRQSEVLQSLSLGLSNKDIALQLGIANRSVEEHINALFSKLGAANRTEAVAIALRKHLLKI